MTSLQSADKWCIIYPNRYNWEKSWKKILGHNKWQVSPALFVLQRPLTPEIFYCMKVKYCVASMFIIYPDLSQWHGTAHRIIKPFHLMYLKGGGVALPSLSLADRMNTDLKGEGEPCLNDSMLFTSSLILVNDSGSEMSNWFYIVGHIKLFLSM